MLHWNHWYSGLSWSLRKEFALGPKANLDASFLSTVPEKEVQCFCFVFLLPSLLERILSLLWLFETASPKTFQEEKHHFRMNFSSLAGKTTLNFCRLWESANPGCDMPQMSRSDDICQMISKNVTFASRKRGKKNTTTTAKPNQKTT